MIAAMLQKELGDGFEVESAAWWKKGIGDPANENSILCMEEKGIDISNHKVRWIGNIDLNQFACIVCVDRDMGDKIRSIIENDKTTILVVNEDGGGLPDPFEKGLPAYRECIALIGKDLSRLAASVRV